MIPRRRPDNGNGSTGTGQDAHSQGGSLVVQPAPMPASSSGFRGTPNLAGRPPGMRTRTTNLVVAGLLNAVLQHGAEYRASRGLPADHDPLSDVDKLSEFIRYAIEKDLKSVLSMLKHLIPRDLVITFAAPVQVEVLPPPDLVTVLEQRGLRLPADFSLSASHRNDDDPEVSEADIVAVVDPPPTGVGQ